MSLFPIHTSESAPDGAKPYLDAAQAKFGMVPNLLGVLANAPAALASYLAVSGELDGSSLTPVELQVVLITTSVENGCEYCVSVHSAIANMAKMPDDALTSLRAGEDPADPRLGALARFTRHVVADRGWVDRDEVQAFLSAGFTAPQVLEVVTGVALKTVSNYTNHLAETPLDLAFEGQRWRAPAAA